MSFSSFFLLWKADIKLQSLNEGCPLRNVWIPFRFGWRHNKSYRLHKYLSCPPLFLYQQAQCFPLLEERKNEAKKKSLSIEFHYFTMCLHQELTAVPQLFSVKQLYIYLQAIIFHFIQPNSAVINELWNFFVQPSVRRVQS